MEYTGLAAEMAELAGRYGSVDPAAADLDALEWALGTGRRLRGILDARDALMTCRLESLIRQRVPAPEPADDPSNAGDSGSHDRGDGSSGASDGAGAGGAGPGRPAGAAHRETAEEYAARLRRAKWLRRLALFEAALEAGTITTAHVDALAAVLEHVEPAVASDALADEDAVLEVARTVTKASFARYLRSRVDRVRADGGKARLRQQVDDSFGSLNQDDDLDLYKLFVRLDPIRGEQVFTAVRRRVEQLQQSGAMEGKRRGQVIAQAVTDLICGAADGGAGGANVLVVVDLLTLLRGTHDGSICETGDGAAIPVDVVRDLCRRAGTTVTAAVRDANGVTFAVGDHARPDDATPRSRRAGPETRPGGGEHGDTATADEHAGAPQSTEDIAAMIAEALGAATGDSLQTGRDLRLANRAQRRALRAMYRSCAHPGCRVPFADCFIHHVIPWEDDGPTDLANLLPLCGRHHHQIHDGGWRLTIDPARTLRWYRPGGRLDTEERFEPLGATSARVVSGSSVAPAGEHNRAEGDPGGSISTGERATHAAGPATDGRWTRSRGARGAPPATEQDALQLFDPTAA